MPPKRLSPLEDPPAASSSEEEEEDDEEEEDHEGDEEEDEEEDDDEEGEDGGKQVKGTAPTSADKKPPVKKPTPNPGAAPNPATRSVVANHNSDDEDDDDSGTESGSDSEPSPEKSARPSRSADPNVKPISSKPMDDGSKSKKHPVKPSAAPAASTPQAKSTAPVKRPTESDKDDGKDSKRRKKKAADEDEDAGVSEDAEKKPGEKKQLFQRLWTEDDELAILKGMLDYYSKKGADPSTDMNAFHDFIKKSLHVDVSKNQLADKIRRLRKKYLNNAGRGKEGEDPVFSKPHEHKAFELSKKIWGLDSGNDVANDQTVSNGKLGTARKAKNPVSSPQSKANQHVSEVSKVAAVKAEEEIDWSMYPNLAESFQTQKEAMWIMNMPRMGDSIVKEGARLVGTSKLNELEQKWNKLRKEEIDLFFRRMELMREQVKLMQEASDLKK